MDARIFEPLAEPVVSVFNCCYETEPAGVAHITSFLFPKNHKDKIDAYRACKDEEKRLKMKRSLICVTPSGIFSQRGAKYLEKHSEIICIDLDEKHNPDIDLPGSKHILGKHLPSLYYAGLSLGGEGIFLLVRISNPEMHAQHFAAIASELEKRFGLTVDKAVKSVASPRVVSYDEDPYFNRNPAPYEQVMDTGKGSKRVIRTAADRQKIIRYVERAIAIIREKRIDITNQYEHWRDIGFAFVHEFGEEGRTWFHWVSRMYEKFNEGDCDYQYDKCLRYAKEDGCKIGTFFYHCKAHGVEYWKE